MEVRTAAKSEFIRTGELMVKVYAALPGFPSPEEQPGYYRMLRNLGELTKNAGTEIIIAVEKEEIVGAVVFFRHMKYYGSGGTATSERQAGGFRLLAVHPDHRGKGYGRILTEKCIEKAREAGLRKMVIHSTRAMMTAWKMYEGMGFVRATDLDFIQGELQVYGFRLHF